jgi:hypothetical protein
MEHVSQDWDWARPWHSADSTTDIFVDILVLGPRQQTQSWITQPRSSGLIESGARTPARKGALHDNWNNGVSRLRCYHTLAPSARLILIHCSVTRLTFYVPRKLFTDAHACIIPVIDWTNPNTTVSKSTSIATQNVYHCTFLRRSNPHLRQAGWLCSIKTSKKRKSKVDATVVCGQRRPTLRPVRGAVYEPYSCSKSRRREAIEIIVRGPDHGQFTENNDATTSISSTMRTQNVARVYITIFYSSGTNKVVGLNEPFGCGRGLQQRVRRGERCVNLNLNHNSNSKHDQTLHIISYFSMNGVIGTRHGFNTKNTVTRKHYRPLRGMKFAHVMVYIPIVI